MTKEEVDRLRDDEACAWEELECAQQKVIALRSQWARAHEKRQAAEQELSRELYDPIEKGG